jgi:pimeloyl-ACP methyl ester carboxylesterase/catechol 2,3-dioxygenase-like lactoylglutathione lyase family enzyme
VSASDTELVTVSSEAAASLDRVEAPGETIAAGAIERDPGAEPPPSVNAAVVPADVIETVVATAEVQPVPAADGGATEYARAPEATPRPGEAEVVEKVIVTADGLSMHYLSAGKSERTVVFLHGWCGNAAQWKQHIAPVARRYRVIAVDLVGHGKSRGQSRETWSIPGFGNDVVTLLEAEELENVVLVGHGMGGQIALSVAARAPERISGIIGVDCLQRLGGDPDPAQTKRYVERFRAAYGEQMSSFVAESAHGSTPPDVQERILRDSLEPDPSMALALMEHFGEHDPRPAVRAIDCRVICINSETIPTEVDSNHGLLPGYELVLMEDVGHWVHLEAPVLFQERLLETLRRLEPPDAVEAASVLSPILMADDVEALARFYVERLGFVQVDRKPIEPDLEAGIISLERDGASLVVQSIKSLDVDFPAVDVPIQAGVFFLRVGSLDAEQKRLGDGATVVIPERTLSTGSKQLVIKDPVGNLVVLQEPR